jgi:hypothetical protein
MFIFFQDPSVVERNKGAAGKSHIHLLFFLILKIQYGNYNFLTYLH